MVGEGVGVAGYGVFVSRLPRVVCKSVLGMAAAGGIMKLPWMPGTLVEACTFYSLTRERWLLSALRHGSNSVGLVYV